MNSASNAPRPARGGFWKRLRRGELVPALLFISPWIVGFACFQLYPIIASIYYSFTAYNIMLPPVYIGISNYRQLFINDSVFHQALTNTLFFTAASVPIGLVVSFLLALLLNLKFPGRALFRAVFFFPSVVPAVATGIVWTLLLRTRGGLVNTALGLFGVPAISWLESPQWAIPTLILVSVWGIGPAMVIFLAGLQDVPRALYEAAEIDGAGPIALVRHVTIPLLAPVIVFNLIIGMVYALQAFAIPFVVFSGNNAGGGPLDSALLYSVQLFTVAFSQFQMGYAAAMSWILFVIIAILSLVSLRLSNRFVLYE
jgi:multiple sugar transport system permease protein